MIRLGIPAMSEVVINPNTPNPEIRIKPVGKPMAAVSNASFMLNTV